MTYWLLNVPLFALILYALLVGLRYPHIRRMALRKASIRKPATLLTVLGLAVSTTLITIVLTVNHSLENSSDTYLRAHFGAIDYEVHAIRQENVPAYYFNEREIENLRRSLEGLQAGVLPIVSYAVTLIHHQDGTPGTTFPNVLVMGVDLAEAKNFEPISLTDDLPQTLPSGSVILSTTAAEKLQVREGESVQILDLHDKEREFRVDRVVDEAGLTGYRGMQEAYATAIVSLDAARELFGLGDRTFTSALISGYQPPGPWDSVAVKGNAKSRMYETANFVSFLFGISSVNAVIMGVILMFNLFQLLSDERRLETGILRSIGFSRVDLKRMLRLEGLFYSAAAGWIGSAAGIGLGALLTGNIAERFGQNQAAERVYFFDADLSVILAGCSIGIAIVYMCMLIISSKATRQPITNLLGSPFIRTKLKDPSFGLSFYTWYSILVFAFVVCCAVILSIPAVRREWLTDANLPIAAAGMLALIPFVAFAMVRWLEWGYGRLQPALRKIPAVFGMMNIAIKNMCENRIRSGLLILMFTGVSCFIGFAIMLAGFMQTILGHSDQRRLIGGFDLYAYDYYTTDNTITRTEDLGEFLKQAGFDDRTLPEYTAVAQLPWKTVTMNGIDAAYARTNDIQLLEREPSFANDRDVWLEVASNPDVMVVSSGTLRQLTGSAGNNRVGDRAELRIAGASVSKRIIGIAQEASVWYPFSFGIWMNQDETIRLGKDDKRLHSALLMRFPSTEKAGELQPQIERALLMHNSSPVYNIVDSENSYLTGMGVLMTYFENFNTLAMVIGIVGLAVVLFRLARQRRHQMGVLRAVGIPPRWLHFCMWAEGSVMAWTGITAGFAIGACFGYLICLPQLSGDYVGVTFDVPVVRLFTLYASFMAAAGACANMSARYVYRIPPSEATKYMGLSS